MHRNFFKILYINLIKAKIPIIKDKRYELINYSIINVFKIQKKFALINER